VVDLKTWTYNVSTGYAASAAIAESVASQMAGRTNGPAGLEQITQSRGLGGASWIREVL
jgi:hypothetical protein